MSIPTINSTWILYQVFINAYYEGIKATGFAYSTYSSDLKGYSRNPYIRF